MKTIEINGQQIKYTGTFTNIQIHHPKGLSLSEQIGIISQIIVKQRKDEVGRTH